MADQLKLPSSFEPEPEAQSPSDKKSGLPPSFIPEDIPDLGNLPEPPEGETPRIKVSKYLTAKGKAPTDYKQVINEQHPDLAYGDRTALQTVAHDQASKADYLKRVLGYDVSQDEEGLLIQKPTDAVDKKTGYKPWYRIERLGGWPEWSDITDASNELASAAITGVGTAIGALGGGLGAAAGGGSAAFLSETGRQRVGEEMDFRDVSGEKLTTAATEGVVGAALPGASKVALKAGGALLEAPERGIAKILESAKLLKTPLAKEDLRLLGRTGVQKVSKAYEDANKLLKNKGHITDHMFRSNQGLINSFKESAGGRLSTYNENRFALDQLAKRFNAGSGWNRPEIEGLKSVVQKAADLPLPSTGAASIGEVIGRGGIGAIGVGAATQSIPGAVAGVVGPPLAGFAGRALKQFGRSWMAKPSTFWKYAITKGGTDPLVQELLPYIRNPRQFKVVLSDLLSRLSEDVDEVIPD